MAKYCGECGEKLHYTATKFCTECGNPVYSALSQQDSTSGEISSQEIMKIGKYPIPNEIIPSCYDTTRVDNFFISVYE